MTQDVLAPGIPGLTQADVERIAAGDPAWLRERRLAAWRTYESLDLPDPGDEEWRRTPIHEIAFGPAVAYSAAAPVPDATALPAVARGAWDGGPAAGNHVQVDSSVVLSQFADEVRAQGVVLMDLRAAAASEHGGLVERYLYSLVPAEEWKFVALNAAVWSAGAFVYVPRGVDVRLPLRLITAAQTASLLMAPRVLVVVEPEARLSLIDESVSEEAGAQRVVSAATELIVGDGAEVQYYSINRWGRDALNFNTVRARLGRDAKLTALAAGIGSKLTKMRIDVEMPEAGAETQLLGITFGDDEQHFDYNTRQEHVGAHTVSDLQFKSALTDRASLVWYGVTRINPGASASEANQTSRNLLLSEHAKAAPIPILEIEAYDVAKCSHGATVGPVEEEELFYLESRGIPRETAEQMLVEGFFADVADRIPDARLRERLIDAVLAKAGGSAGSLTYEDLMEA